MCSVNKMRWLVAVVLSFTVAAVVGRKFPFGFKFGASTSSYQVEGAWNVSDKTPNIWDTFVRIHPKRIIDKSTGDIACDSYNKWENDVEIATDLGLHFYRFSISWTRLMPTGFPNYISEDGKKYYNNLIDALLAKGIEPLVTLYHWDLPQSLQDLGGWTNPLLSDWFADYAREIFSLYGDRVKIWLTLNEPVAFCDFAYNTGNIAPGVFSPGFGNYLCMKTAMLAHAKAYRVYDKEFRPKQKGKVSLSNHMMWFEANTESDEEAAETARQLMVGMYSHPIYSKRGDWPSVIKEIVAENSKIEGRPQSRLPSFSPDEILLIRGTYDFYALNSYTSRIVIKTNSSENVGPWPFEGSSEIGVRLSVRPEWEHNTTTWLYINAVGLRRSLSWLKKEYGDIEIFITENGAASSTSDLDDSTRIKYYKDHLEQVILSINEDKVKVTGYTAWTMIDNFEWMDGYGVKFGLYQVDFEDPQRTRKPRASAHYYASVIKSHSLDINIDKKVNEEL